MRSYSLSCKPDTKNGKNGWQYYVKYYEAVKYLTTNWQTLIIGYGVFAY